MKEREMRVPQILQQKDHLTDKRPGLDTITTICHSHVPLTAPERRINTNTQEVNSNPECPINTTLGGNNSSLTTIDLEKILEGKITPGTNLTIDRVMTEYI